MSRFKMRCSQKVKIKLFTDKKKLFNHYSEALKFLKTYRFIQICECINVKFYDFCSFQKLKDFLLYCKSYIFLYIKKLKIIFCFIYHRIHFSFWITLSAVNNIDFKAKYCNILKVFLKFVNFIKFLCLNSTNWDLMVQLTYIGIEKP